MVESTKFHDRIVAHSEATIAPVPLAFAAIHIIKYFMAGTVAGLSECASSYPLDTIKTRLQAPAGRGSFGGPLECLLKTVREDGPLALYRGMSSRLLANMLSSSIMFGANGMLKELLHADSSKPMSARFMMAATGTGVLEAIAYTPLELVKTRMQVLRGHQLTTTTLSTARHIYVQQGIAKGLYRGVSAMLLRDGLGNNVYFCSYEISKQALAGLVETPGSVPGNSSIVMAGGVAGVLYTASVHPIDTVKSLMQTDSMSSPRYTGFVDCLKQAVAKGGGGMKGFLGLYRGLSPAMSRAFIGNAALFLAFENTMDAMGR